MASIKRIGKDKFGVPIWNVHYRRAADGKKVNRHIHAATKAEVELQIMSDTRTPVGDLKWSEGLRLYLDAKLADGKTSASMEHVQRAVDVFIKIKGDMKIESVTPGDMKNFMQKVVNEPVKHKYSGKEYRKSGPKVANHHRKELMTVARYLLKHTDRISTIPFINVPPLPVKSGVREPIPEDKVTDYIDALPPHTRRPVIMVLLYGLRSSAVCNLTMDSVERDFLNAVDKFDFVRAV